MRAVGFCPTCGPYALEIELHLTDDGLCADTLDLHEDDPTHRYLLDLHRAYRAATTETRG
jgi:hypothetical protein